jgi:hypothetical protein
MASSANAPPLRIEPNPATGEIILGHPYRNAVIYSNRRTFCGRGFAVELHTASLQRNESEPTVRHALEVAVVVSIDEASGLVTKRP